jgi:hypothetical protein
MQKQFRYVLIKWASIESVQHLFVRSSNVEFKKIFPAVQALIPGQRRVDMHDLSARRAVFKFSFSKERLRTPMKKIRSAAHICVPSLSPCRWLYTLDPYSRSSGIVSRPRYRVSLLRILVVCPNI